jgi:NAD(P)-dependent dehydrogenase (short-subunit alcohol dehydrogenase family)
MNSDLLGPMHMEHPMSANDYVAIVTGASRGLGRGMARGFGLKGATVYVTGRDLKGAENTAQEVTAAGGKGVAIQCDHSDDAQVAALFKRIEQESGKIDILVNNAAAVYGEDLVTPGPFWEKPLRLAEMMDVGMRSNYIASYYAAPIMAKAKKGLIATISFYGAVSYFHGAAYGAAKAGNDKMTFDMSKDLLPFNVAAVSIWPGFIRTEVIAAIPDDQVPEFLKPLWPLFENPEFTALAIDALYRDPDLMAQTGKALIGAELGVKYNVQDINGKQPPSFRDTMGSPITYFEVANPF